MKKKVFIAVLCMAMLIVGGMATMAYLTDEDANTNTFTSGKVDILLDEAKVDDKGLKVEGEEAERVKANEYQLFPGHTYDKDPTVTVVEGSEDCYVRMLVTINKQEALDEAFSPVGGLDLTTFLKEYNSAEWQLKGETVANDTRTYEFWYKEIAEPGTLPALFTQVHIPGEITVGNDVYNIGNDQMAAFNGLEIKVVAHAIQAEGFDKAEKAWAVWKNWATWE